LADKMRAYNLQDEGHDTVNANLMLHLPADAREYALAALMLKDLHVEKVDIMTNNPDKIKGLRENGIQVVSRTSMVPQKWQKMIGSNGRSQTPSVDLQDMDVYLLTKINRMGHDLDVPDSIRQLSNDSADALE
jgi:GTP cyclohydrolase II